MDEPLRALVEVHQRDETLVMSRGAIADQPGGRRRWVVGDLVAVGATADEVGSLVGEMIAAGVQRGPDRSAAEANGQWCAAFGQDTLDGLIDGLRSLVIVVRGGQVVMAGMGEDGRPLDEQVLSPATLADVDRCGEAVLGALARIPPQRSRR